MQLTFPNTLKNVSKQHFLLKYNYFKLVHFVNKSIYIVYVNGYEGSKQGDYR